MSLSLLLHAGQSSGLDEAMELMWIAVPVYAGLVFFLIRTYDKRTSKPAKTTGRGGDFE